MGERDTNLDYSRLFGDAHMIPLIGPCRIPLGYRCVSACRAAPRYGGCCRRSCSPAAAAAPSAAAARPALAPRSLQSSRPSPLLRVWARVGGRGTSAG
eukprot:scaffold307_cov390-Prasinococcus_capsulatus_cf.AAC.37